MAIKRQHLTDIGDKLKNSIKESADKLTETAEKVKETAKGIELPDVSRKTQSIRQLRKSFVLGSDRISTSSALKIIYYVIAADGEICQSEMDMFISIGQELDVSFADHQKEIESICQSQLDKMINSEDREDVIKEGIEDALRTSVPTDEAVVTAKLLVWNLLIIAYSDDDYSREERKIIRYTARKCHVDKDVYLEMDYHMQALMALEAEETWIKTVNKPYLEIEAMVNEIEDRKNVIFNSVKTLIAV